MTSGWLAGSSTAAVVWLRQSSAPLSPDAAKIVCPWVAASANNVCSLLSSELSVRLSQTPQEVETTFAVSSETIAW